MKNLLLSILVLTSQFCFSQAWTKKKGTGYEQIGISYINGNRLANNNKDELQLNRAITDITISEYIEYGLTNKFTLITSIPFKLESTSSKIYENGSLPDTLTYGKINGLSNINFSIIYGLKQKGNWVSSIKLKTDLPTAQYKHNIGLRTGYDALGIAPSLLFGKSKNNHFGTIEFGVNYRTNNYSTQLFSLIQVGTKFKNTFHAILVFDYLKSLQNGNYNDQNSIHTGVYLNDIEWTAFILKFGYLLNDKIIIWSSIGGGIFSGYATTRAPSFSLAVSYEW